MTAAVDASLAVFGSAVAQACSREIAVNAAKGVSRCIEVLASAQQVFLTSKRGASAARRLFDGCADVGLRAHAPTAGGGRALAQACCVAHKAPPERQPCGFGTTPRPAVEWPGVHLAEHFGSSLEHPKRGRASSSRAAIRRGAAAPRLPRGRLASPPTAPRSSYPV